MGDRTRFFGRTDELARLDARLRNGERLVTLVGAPGAGKTRLARRLIESKSGAVFCSLRDARSADDAMVAIVAAVAPSVASPHADDAHAAIVAKLASAPALLVLDELEQLAPAATATISRLLDALPALQIVVTSRIPIGVDGQACVTVGSLDEVAAVELFVDRARAVRAAFALDDATRVTVAELVDRLDRLPLAIELAAGRANVLAPRELLERLDTRLDLLRSATAGVDEKHRTLRGAIDTSWEGLPAHAQRALAWASPFRGGFALAAFEEVFGEPSAVDTIDLLCRASLVTAQDTSCAATRFSLYESVRDYAEERLVASGQADAAYARHAEHYAANADAVVEAQNLAVAFERSVSRAPALAARILLALDPQVRARGPLARHADRLGRAIAALESFDDLRLRGRLLVARAYVRSSRGETSDALCDIADAQRIVDVIGAGDVETEMLSVLSLVMHAQGKFDEALALLLPKDSGHVHNPDQILRAVGVLYLGRGELEVALAYFARAIAIARTIGDRRHEATILALTSMAHHELGDFGAARLGLNDTIALVRETGDRFVEGVAHLWLAQLRLDEGDVAVARETLDAARAILEEVGDSWFHRSVIGYTGIFDHIEGDLASARARLEDAVVRVRREQDHYRLGIFLPHLAAVRARTNDLSLAYATFDEARCFASASASPNLLPVTDVLESFAEPETAAVRVARAAKAAARSSDVRFALRLVASAGLAEVAAPESDRGVRLVVASDFSWFALESTRVDLAKRAPLRRILACLVDRRRHEPGRATSAVELLSSGWPGERVAPSAGQHRVHVAIAALRKLGFGDHLRKVAGGYAIEARVRVVDA